MPTKHIHLEVPANQYRFMLKLLEALPFVRVAEPTPPQPPAATAGEQRIYDNVAQGFRELKLARKGKIQARPIEDILNELAD